MFALREGFHGFSLQTTVLERQPMKAALFLQRIDVTERASDRPRHGWLYYHQMSLLWEKSLLQKYLHLTRCWWYFLAADAYLRAVHVSPAGSWDQSAEGQSKTEKSLRIKGKSTISCSMGRKIPIGKHCWDTFNMLV